LWDERRKKFPRHFLYPYHHLLTRLCLGSPLAKNLFMNEDTIDFIKNFFFKRDAIFRNYTRYGDECDAQAYFLGQLEANPNYLHGCLTTHHFMGKVL